MINMYVIGAGGIGGYLIDCLPMAISSISLDVMEAHGMPASEYLKKAGSVPLLSIVDRLTVVDGDIFEARNALRQGAGAGSKLAQRMKAFEHDMARVSYLQRMQLVGYDNYVNPTNIKTIIPRNPEPNPDNADTCRKLFGHNLMSDTGLREVPTSQSALDKEMESEREFARMNASVVFLCVDNLKTRYEVSKYMESFDDCLVLNGGNSRTSGHVTVYERAGGVALDPEIYKVYPNIRPDADRRPDEVGNCTDVAPKHDQIAITNSIVANLMMAVFVKWVRRGLYEANGDRHNEILVDIEVPTVMAVYHQKL